MLTQTIAQYSASEIGTEVRAGLTKAGQKELPSKYLYDEVGSALFEAISVIPEYGLTRADERLLQKFAGKIVAHLPSPVLVAELGSGSGKKTRWILEALSSRQRTFYYPIEISPTALAQCKKELGQIDLVSVVGYERPYLDGLLAVAARRLPRERLLVLFLGSTIGNFDRDAGEEFLSEVRRILAPGDALLLSSDLVKPVPQLLAAYDDPAGASAFGVEDLLGNGWEWTRTVFQPFEGFRPFAFYPGYSADFFDGQHFVMKGGSARTAACMLRRSFRNWFQPHYRYAYAGFRCVQE